MKASDATLQTTLNTAYQYVIPVFQRYYSWKEKDWQQLWNDVVELLEPENKDRNHFMGALVLVPGENMPKQVPTYYVIDGQQRLVTLSVFLCALRVLATKAGTTQIVQEITDSYLLHPHRQGFQRFRVYPRQRDRDAYLHAVLQDGVPQAGITGALEFFINRIEEAIAEGVSLFDLYNAITSRLDFVHITLKGENPYGIFKSLNSTGVELSEADLIRNFFFMGVPTAEQDDFDDTLWAPLENKFSMDGGGLDGTLFSEFLRHFLMSDGQYVSPKSTFQEFEATYRDRLDARQLANTEGFSCLLATQLRTTLSLILILFTSSEDSRRTIDL
ncbi:MAG: DUF262 domain-containing protein [Acidobacteria bacterium]|nr:DUF262 domain-containing protein [Acidobacteriota bacterium]